MRFAIPPAGFKTKLLTVAPREWPLGLRFAATVIPFSIAVALLGTWIGYRASSVALHDSLSSVALLEAKLQASRMEETLLELRKSLFFLAEQPEIDELSIKNSLRLFFHENEPLVQEIGFKDAQQNGFLLLRDKTDFIRLSPAEASHGLYSPFQQLNSIQLSPGQAALYPPVYFEDPAHISKAQADRSPVMRMALMLPDESGTLVLGISLSGLHKVIAAQLGPGAPLRLPAHDGGVQMTFFFDTRGWILFEASSIGGKSFLPDLSREGYLGDLGRAGYDAAFRPWAAHDDFWRMVTEVQAGKSGQISAPADKYSTGNVGATGLLCFAPVAFAASDGAAPTILGGIAFFETSTLPLAAFLRLANYSLAVMVGAILLAAFLAYRVNAKLGLPIKRMATELGAMASSGELGFITREPASDEQHRLQNAVNTIIAGALQTRNQFEQLSHEVEHTRSRLPVDIGQGKEASLTYGEFGLVGSSPLMREVREHVYKAAKAGTDVLVWGETGTGKELVAAAIHKASARRTGPYISINCGALDENLLLDALFGHVKGAFTEAKNDRKGAFLAAQGGTLHLDEIANASLKVQQALLRALSVRRIRPLGTDDEIAFNTRVVAATNVDLRDCVRAGTFREDLYYRLAIISIQTPPLRQRKEDIPELAAHCIHDSSITLGRPEARLSRGALDLMYAYDWPGNVRELKNCLTRAMAFVEDDLILAHHITLEQESTPVSGRPLASFPERESRLAGSEERSAKRKMESGSKKRAHPPLDVATGPSKVAESLFPAPPRDTFTPAVSPARDEQAVDIPPSINKAPPSSTPHSPGASPFVPPSGTADTIERHALPPHEQAPPDYRFPDPVPRPTPANSPAHGAPAAPPYADGRAVDGGHPGGAGRAADRFAGLNERQLKALAFAREQGRISRPQYQNVAGAEVSARTLQNDLRELVDRGIFKRIGAGPATCYELGDTS